MYRDFTLPKPLSQGLVMKVNNFLKENIAVNISGKISSNNNAVYVIAQSKGKIYFQTAASLTSTGNLQINIPKNSLPEGVSQITLFSSSGEPASERLVYIDRQNKLNFNISSEKSSYFPREKITLQLQVKDLEGKPLLTNISLAVTDSNIFTDDYSTENIFSYLNLSSEIKGEIENPAWYFGENKSAALDDLLLTQGWRRFTWPEILEGEAPETNFYVEKELSLKGRAMDKSTGKRALGSSVTMTVSGENPLYVFDLTNDKGIFEFNELNLTGPQTFFLKAIEKYSVEENLEINIDSIPAPGYHFKSTDINNESRSKTAYNKLIRDSKIIEESFEYYLPAEEEVASIQKSNLKKEALKISYYADEVIEMEDFTSFSSMVDVIRELVRGVIIRKKGEQYRIRVLDSVTKYYFKKEPVYLIDGIPVDNANEVMNLDPSTVKLITISKPPDNFYDFGVLGEAGVLAIYTTEMNKNLENSIKTFKVDFKGYDRPREFYAPDHGSKSLPVNIPDFRPLLYWNPNVITDKDGKATVSFYASDDITKWEVKVEGLSNSGIPGIGKYTFEIKFPEN
ncbi:hypothetical protein BH23BAC1_BH23BAC1_34710 [soil metagenome]